MDDISPATGGMTYAGLGDGRGVTLRSDIQWVVREAIRDAVTQLERAEQRVEDERAQAVRERDRADQAERRTDEVLAEARDLRQRLDVVEAQRGREHDRAARAEAETKARDQWGLGRRLAWALLGR